MAVTAAVGSIAVGAFSANEQRKVGKKALKGSANVQAKQDFYNELLMDLLRDPGSITRDPGYQFSFAQGLQAVERSNASRGLTGSGNVSVDLLRFGEEFSSRFLQQRENLLAGLSGAGAASSPAQLLQVGTGANSSSTDILSSTLASLGYSFGAGGFGRASGGAAAGTPASVFQRSIDMSNAFAPRGGDPPLGGPSSRYPGALNFGS